MPKLLNFDLLWNQATMVNKACNSIYYHPCCDVWTTRSSRIKRSSHTNYLPWRKLLSTLDKTSNDKKQALRTKMIEEGWRLPAVINEGCKNQANTLFQPQGAFRLINSERSGQKKSASFSSQAFVRTKQEDSLNNLQGIF